MAALTFFSQRYSELCISFSPSQQANFDRHYFTTSDPELQRLLLNNPSYGRTYSLMDELQASGVPDVDKILTAKGRKTPFNTSHSRLRLLIGCHNFSQLTGMPIYNYRLGRELVKRGCEVTIVSPSVGGEIAQLAKDAGMRVFAHQDGEHQGEYDILLLNELWSGCLLEEFPQTPAWYYCHSKYEIDAPLPKRPQIRGYFAPRREVADYWHKETGLEIGVIPIPIDLDEFSPQRTKRRPTYRILVPCTFNEIREPMVKDILKRARKNPKIEVLLKGEDFRVVEKLELPKNVRYERPDTDIRPHIAWADEVAGIYVGTVTLEAWAMGKRCSIYDEKGDYVLMDPPKDFAGTYDAKVVAQQFLDAFNTKWADIIIPHHDQTELLAQLLRTIPLRNYNVIIVRGGTFAHNCNKGAKLAVTNQLIFLNDDLILNPQALWELLEAPQDLVGMRQHYPDGEPLCLGIFINQFGNYELTNDPGKAMYPSGAIFRIRREVFGKVGGFDERFRNGGEDQDLFLRTLEAGYSVGFGEGSVVHYCSQSEGRFDFLNENDNLLHSLWPSKRLKKVLGAHYANNSDPQLINQ